MSPGVSVVIPSFNGQALLARYIPLLIEALPDEAEVIVIDDASTDGTSDFLRDYFPSVKVVILERNAGFGPACNAGVSASQYEVVLLLNNDVRVTPGFLQPLLDRLAEPDVFAVSPRIIRGDGTGLDESCFRPTWWRGRVVVQMSRPNDDESASPLFYASGAAAVIVRSKFMALGGFDPMLAPFYWEDVDLGYRAWKRGWRTLREPASTVYHEHSATIRQLSRPDTQAIIVRNQEIFFWKNIHDSQMLAVHLAFLPLRVSQALLKRDIDLLRGLAQCARLFPVVWHTRQIERQRCRIADRVVLTQHGAFT